MATTSRLGAGLLQASKIPGGGRPVTPALAVGGAKGGDDLASGSPQFSTVLGEARQGDPAAAMTGCHRVVSGKLCDSPPIPTVQRPGGEGPVLLPWGGGVEADGGPLGSQSTP